MNTLVRNILGVVMVAMVGLGLGCGNKEGSGDTGATGAEGATEATGTTSASGLPGAQEAMASLDKKDWDGAVAAVVRARQGVSTAEQETQFTTLVDEVKIRLIDEAPSDPKAAQALGVLRQLTGGR